jgi:hypothetical protein
MPNYKNKKNNLEGLLVENLKKNAEIMHSTFLRTINSAVISLFWEIGSRINTNLKNKSSDDGGKFEISLISDHLIPFFGAYMTQENLLLMKRFAAQCNEATMTEISYFTNWQYVPILLDLEHNDAWIYYVHYIHKESLSPEQLQRKIKTHSFKILDKDNPQDRIISLMLNESKAFHQNTLNLYFGEITGGMFQNLFEPKLESKLNFDSLLKEQKPDLELTLQIYASILEFQSRYNYILNNLFNGFCYGIGDEIIRVATIFNTQVTDSLLDHCIAELGENFPSIFNRGHLLDCLKFAEHFKEQELRNEIKQIVSWPFIKILNKIDSIDMQLIIAKGVFHEGISIEELKKMIVEGSFDYESIKNSHSKEMTNKNSGEVEKTKSRNSTLTVTKEVHELRISSKSDVNRNIFKNPDILKFLGEH